MAARTIETRAILSAEDRTGPAFAAVVQHMAKMEDAARRAKASVSLTGAAGSSQASALRQSRRDELNHLRQTQRIHENIGGRQLAIAAAGAAIAHSTAHFAHRSLEVYREFDKERRFGKAVMGISDADQAPLVRQAIRMGGSTKYNDIQVLEAQRELAARGLNKDQIIGMMGAASDLGQSLDLSLPDAVKQMEGAIFGFKKNITSTADAMASARQTADVQVRAAKISGMTPEDIRETYKYGATPAHLSGVSEQTLLAFGGISKKANMGGSEAGTAFRALMSAGNAPTRGAKEALLANHLDYSKYQKQVSEIPLEGFTRNVAAQYGVKLNAKATNSLAKIFKDPKVLNDAALFTPAVTAALGSALGKKDAKSLKSIAGMANRFRTAAGGGADVNAFMADLMIAMSKPGSGIALANAIFGAKQGGRIANALGDAETFKKMIETLKDHSAGYAEKISTERMAGFDGAMSRMEGAIKNLESALPRAFDADGKGGALTTVTNLSGKLIQALAEAPPQIQRLGVEAGLVAGAFAGLKGAQSIMGGFGLKGAAIELSEAARELMGAAKVQTGESILGGAGSGKAKAASRAVKVLKSLPIIGTIALAGEEGLDWLHNDVLEDSGGGGSLSEDRKKQFGPWLPAPKRMSMGGNSHAASFHRSSAPRLNFTPIGAPGSLLPTFANGGGAPIKQEVGVHVDQPPPIKVIVEAGSSLLAIAQDAKAVTLKMSATIGHDAAPGGLGETGTGQH